MRKKATEREICQALAKYKVGDLVTILVPLNTISDNAVLEPGDIAEIINITMICKMDIELEDIQKYEAESDKCFLYELKWTNPKNRNETEKIFAYSKEFEIGIVQQSKINDILKNKKQKLSLKEKISICISIIFDIISVVYVGFLGYRTFISSEKIFIKFFLAAVLLLLLEFLLMIIEAIRRSVCEPKIRKRKDNND